MPNIVENYDVVIVGAGPAGLFSAYELITAKKNLKILLCFLLMLV